MGVDALTKELEDEKLTDEELFQLTEKFRT